MSTCMSTNLLKCLQRWAKQSYSQYSYSSSIPNMTIPEVANIAASGKYVISVVNEFVSFEAVYVQ